MDNIKHNSSTLLANIIYQKKKKKMEETRDHTALVLLQNRTILYLA